MVDMALSPQLALRFRSWGGARSGAGRKPRRRVGGVPHQTRPVHVVRHPVHVTLRLRGGLPSLRSQVIAALIRRAFKDSSRRWFRVVHYSIQSNHLHLLVEADDRVALSRGSAALSIRLARRLNALLGRKGVVFPERYHARSLKTPREVRNAIVYALLNAHKSVHGSDRGARGTRPSLDPGAADFGQQGLTPAAMRPGTLLHYPLGMQAIPAPFEGEMARRMIEQSAVFQFINECIACGLPIPEDS